LRQRFAGDGLPDEKSCQFSSIDWKTGPLEPQQIVRGMTRGTQLTTLGFLPVGILDQERFLSQQWHLTTFGKQKLRVRRSGTRSANPLPFRRQFGAGLP
jgi:hypothetical protein